ncbi:Ig-like domain-containing protein [Spongiibacter tropicus]|uniref:Ig-like domain-containing protein n=1 Tax=Spongiibacter tropicus TaxID=454602 RepID=UPI0003B56BC4|nr:hypothetical protein [Spongiibacter tropicus]
MKLLLRAGILTVATVIAACGGGGGSDGPSISPGEGGSNTDGGDNDTGQDSVVTVFRFGSLSGTNFNAGEIASNRTTLEAGQSATLTVSIIDQDGSLVTDDASVLFSSLCAGQGLAEFSSEIVDNTSGTISTTYTARGCDGDDEITARTSLGGSSYSATVTLSTQPAPLGAISFVSASETQIGIKGSGALPEQATLSFKVTNAAGAPIPNQDVTFSLNNSVGGITISNTNDVTDASGIASTTVAAGTIATTVSVKAKAVQNGIETTAQSFALAVTTGVPDQDSFSLSASQLNIEGLDYDGTTTSLTIRAADRFNNPAPDGTTVTFRAEGGSVTPSCATVSGACSVTLTSQEPRPSDGRITVLATTSGEESFADTSPSNGQYDDGELLFDLPEAFSDDNENGIYDVNTEFFVDIDNEGDYDAADGLYSGILCKGPNNCSTQEQLTLRESIVIVFSGSSQSVQVTPSSIDLDGGPVFINVTINDVNGQLPPAGTTVSATSDFGAVTNLSGNTVLSSNLPGPAVFSYRINQAAQPGQGTFTVTVTTPIGIVSKGFATVEQTIIP